MVPFRETRPKLSGFGGFIARLSEIVAEARVDYARWRLYRGKVKELQALGADDRNLTGTRRRDIRRLTQVAGNGHQV
ncbi:hypothetical protein [Thalassobacter stenotrophicus]|uniref:Uncharacterized protein n=2 Tax=Thalassobacter stenotrophicus TaxID=266809 RepID=A0A0P1FF91_9RHOB|nr:hypothetical protein [Thalassobacter stenotrophicus]CUH60340.1 hypothetical protein THS5294_01629 [Thalassobacter stenotrophicus]SHI73103.1 hypothetical protein SAMN02744035_01422 [Thalassobacter stenotrophicus DSM 16310]